MPLRSNNAAALRFSRPFDGMKLNINWPLRVIVISDHRPAPDGPVIFDILLNHHQPLQQRIWPRRAADHIKIDRQKLIDALHDGIRSINSSRNRADAHRNHVFRIRHLIVNFANDFRHFVGHCASDDKQIRLPWREAKYFRSEARNVVTRACKGHHLDGAARNSERHGPHGIAPRPVHEIVQPAGYETFRL